MASARTPWQGMSQVRRVMAELKYMQRQVASGHPNLLRLEPSGDDVNCWRFLVNNFDDNLPGGRVLNADLARLAREHGQGFLLMEVRFPQDYPNEPFLMRVISPRCLMRTGHVTVGGSICIQALVQTPEGWQSNYSFESMLMLVLLNMVDCEAPLRVDFNGWSPLGASVLQHYSEGEARSAFARMLATHGWETGRAPGAHAALMQGVISAAAPPSSALVRQRSMVTCPPPQLQQLSGESLQAPILSQPPPASSPWITWEQLAAQRRANDASAVNPAAAAPDTAGGARDRKRGRCPTHAPALPIPYPLDAPPPAKRRPDANMSLAQDELAWSSPDPAAPPSPSPSSPPPEATTAAAEHRQRGSGGSAAQALPMLERSTACGAPAFEGRPDMVDQVAISSMMHEALSLQRTTEPISSREEQMKAQVLRMRIQRLEAANLLLQQQPPVAQFTPPSQWAPMAAGQKSLRVNLPLPARSADVTQPGWATMQAAPGAGGARATSNSRLDNFEEVQRVLDRVKEDVRCIGTVIKIERFQDPKMQAKFMTRCSEVREAVGGNEPWLDRRLLWHGTSPANVELILDEGFDCRLAGSGVLGDGTYFAQDVSLSLSYVSLATMRGAMSAAGSLRYASTGGLPSYVSGSGPAMGAAPLFGGSPAPFPNPAGPISFGLPPSSTLPPPFGLLSSTPSSPFLGFGAPAAAVVPRAAVTPPPGPAAAPPLVPAVPGEMDASGFSAGALLYFPRQVVLSGQPPPRSTSSSPLAHLLPQQSNKPTPPPNTTPAPAPVWPFSSQPSPPMPLPSSAPGTAGNSGPVPLYQFGGMRTPLPFAAGMHPQLPPGSARFPPAPTLTSPGWLAVTPAAACVAPPGAAPGGAVATALAAAAAALIAQPSRGPQVILLCDVVLGRVGQGAAGLRRPPSGFDSVGSAGGLPAQRGQTFAVFDNAQCIPAYIVTIDPYALPARRF